MKETLQFGNDILRDLLPRDRRWLIVSSLSVKNRLSGQFEDHEATVELNPDLDERILDTWEGGLPQVEAVLGVGGGRAIEAAKYAAWRRDLPLWLAPSALTGDAFAMPSIALRRERRLEYTGAVAPERVLIDFDLIQSAPAHLNRAGAAEILAIHTALWDWQLAEEFGEGERDIGAAGDAARMLARLDEALAEIQAVSKDGIRVLVDLLAAKAEVCRRLGSRRPCEGSEHYWANNAEYCTKRLFVHGELVALGVLLMATLQENEAAIARARAGELGIRTRTEELGLSQQEIAATLMTARDYTDMVRLPYSVLTARPVSLDDAVKIVRKVTE